MDVSKIVSALPQAKPTTPDELPKRKSVRPDGLVGLVNTGNSCYMNASLQALSNCPPFRQYMLECVHGHSATQASGALSVLFKKMWSSERNPGHLNARSVSTAMKNRMFHSLQQQDAQEFLRSLLNQIHDELALLIPAYHLNYISCHHLPPGAESRLDDAGKKSLSRTSTNSRDSRSSSGSNSSLSQLVVQPHLNSSLSQELGPTSSLPRPFRSFSLPNSPSLKPKIMAKGLYTQLSEGLLNSEKKGSSLSIDCRLTCLEEEDKTDEEETGFPEEERKPVLPWSEDDSLAVDIISSNVTKHLRGIHRETMEDDSRSSPGTTAATKTELHQGHSSVITEVFEGLLESRVKCSECKKVSVTKETFQDLSLPIPGRKELMKASKAGGGPEDQTAKVPPSDNHASFSSKMCRVWKTLVDMTRDLVSGPPTSLQDCLGAFFDTSNLNGDNRYFCQHCKNFQNSTKDMSIIRLPEVLCIHLKRFRFDAFFASKISREIDFPLSDLDLSPYMKKGADVEGSHRYELLSIITHYGGAGGGHYIAYGRNIAVNRWYEFNDTHVSEVSSEYIQSVEAYVLFYKKVSTESSSLPLNLAEIVPRSGTMVNSPGLRYISRHWLMLRNSCSRPGPILQYDFACEHGEVLPGMQDLAKYMAFPIRTEVWEELVAKYEGGPAVKSLDVCEQCQSRLKQLLARRKQEKEKIHQIQQNELTRKNETHLLSRHWLKQWQDFIRCESLDLGPPGPINNSPLLCSGPDGKITLSPGSNYRRVSESVWSFFHKLYGGGPLLVTSPKFLPGDDVS